jgi:hypothetical protein
MYLLAICPSIKNCLVNSFGLFVLLVFNFLEFFYILDIKQDE